MGDAPIKSVTSQISIAGQISETQIAQLSDLGFQSVLNLRAPQEKGTLSYEQRQIEALGIPYVNLPMSPQLINEALIEQVVTHIADLPKPLLVHCGSALRASFVVMIYRVIHTGLSLEAAKAEAAELGFDFDQKPPLKAAMEKYFSTRPVKT